MHVAAQAIGIGAHDQHALGMGLEPNHAVHHVHTSALERSRPCGVGGFVEARLQFDQNSHLHAAFGGTNEAARNRAIARRAIQRHLDRLHPRVGGCFVDERLDRARKRLVGVMHHQRPFADDREQTAIGFFGAGDTASGNRRPRRIFERGSIESMNAEQAREVEQLAMEADGVVAELKFALQHIEHFWAH